MKNLIHFSKFNEAKVSSAEFDEILDRTGGKNLTETEKKKLKHFTDGTDYTGDEPFTTGELEFILSRPLEARPLPTCLDCVAKLADDLFEYGMIFDESDMRNIFEYALRSERRESGYFIKCLLKKLKGNIILDVFMDIMSEYSDRMIDNI